ncbi:MAG TPA: STAS/SEC14 domain-containing protein [Sphingobium sp.]|uniref:STAS/SEC14 domain-containing protein n=1 Tax=Sphingobium sp. TaxID=1912891 RepID=UPI002ED0F2D2
MISVSYEEESGIVCTIASGLASVEEFEAYMPRAVELMQRSRARHGRSLHLVDAADNPVQARDTFDHITEVSSPAMEDEDRCAVIVHSTLARMQINRMGDSFVRRFFADREEARTWLLDEAQAEVGQ